MAKYCVELLPEKKVKVNQCTIALGKRVGKQLLVSKDTPYCL